MAQTIVRDGLIIEVLPDGTGKVVGYADDPAPQGQVFTLPQSPKDARQEARQAEADARADEAAARANEASRRAQLEWNATHNADGSPKKSAAGGKVMPDGVAKRYEEAVNAFAALDRAVGGFRDDYAGNT